MMDNKGMLQSAGVVGIFTALSRLLGLARDVLMAGFFGTSSIASAFWYAFTMPNLFRRLFGEGALAAAFVPTFVSTREKEGPEAAWKLARRIGTLLLLVLTLLCLLGIGLTLIWPRLMGEGMSERTAHALPLLRIMLPYMIFICMAALSMGVLNSLGHFAVPAATPCILNITWILVLLFLCPRFGDTPEERIYGVAWGVLLAGGLQLLAQVPILYRKGCRPGWDTAFNTPGVRRVVTLMLPVALGSAVTQVNVFFDRTLSFWISDYATSSLFFSERLVYLPLGIFATSLGTVLLPMISRQAARGEDEQVLQTVNHALRTLLFVMLPAAVGLWVLARPIITMAFMWGEFTEDSVLYTTRALHLYAPGLVVFALAKVFIPVFYGHQDTQTPVKIGLLAVALNICLNILFVLTWKEGYKHAGLALGTVLAECFQVAALAWILHRRYGSPGWGEILRSLLRFSLAAVLMGAASLFAYALIGQPFASAKLNQITAVLGAVSVGMVTYLAAVWLLRAPELREVTGLLAGRFRYKK